MWICNIQRAQSESVKRLNGLSGWRVLNILCPVDNVCEGVLMTVFMCNLQSVFSKSVCVCVFGR